MSKGKRAYDMRYILGKRWLAIGEIIYADKQWCDKQKRDYAFHNARQYAKYHNLDWPIKI